MLTRTNMLPWGSDPAPRRRGAARFALVLAIGLLALATVLGALLVPAEQEDASPRGEQRGAATQPTTATTQPAEPYVTRDDDGMLRWPRPRSDERRDERARMVRTQIGRDAAYRTSVTRADVLAAMRHVPRHAFVPADRRRRAYDDTPLPIGYGQTISQPYIVALMTQLLDIEPGDRVLEIGTGSGYQAAVLSELTPYVYSIEILEPLHEQATQRFARLGYKTIQTRRGDGYFGWEAYAPFDHVIVTCAAGHVPPPLWEQLAAGGRMVIPVGGTYATQRLLVLEKDKRGRRRSRSVMPVRFVPMTGKMQEP